MLKKGDKVFFSDNSTSVSAYSRVAYNTIQALGLYPISWESAGLDFRKSNFDKEIRDDFYQSKVVVLVLGKGEKWMGIEDNWAVPELRHAISMGVKCFVYITPQITEEEIRNLSLPIKETPVRDEKHFENILKQSLDQLLNSDAL